MFHLFFTGHYQGFLLGDSGYPCKHYLLTPYINTRSRAEEKYNSALCRTRVIIEQTFGILKRRFQCLHNELRTSPEQAIQYVLACVVLHNIGIERGDIIDINNLQINVENDDNFNPDVDVHGGEHMRRHIVETFFT